MNRLNREIARDARAAAAETRSNLARHGAQQISVAARDLGAMVGLTVEDNGLRMDSESVRRACEPSDHGQMSRSVPGRAHHLSASRTKGPARSRRLLELTALVMMMIMAWAAQGCHDDHAPAPGAAPGTAQASSGSGPAAAGAGSRAQRPPVQVVAVPAVRGDQPRYLDGLGTVTAYNTSTVRTRVDGPLTKIAFREGQIVHAGDLLAVVDKRTYAAQLEQAKAQLGKDQAALASARADLAHYEAAREALPAQQIEHGHAAVDEAEATIGVDRAQVTSLGLTLEFCDIRSPIDGVIGLRLVDVGNIVHAADSTGIAVVTQVQPIAVIFTLPQGQLPDVQAANRAGPVVADIFDRNLERKITSGRLLAIDNQIDTSTGTARFKAEVENSDRALFPNQFVNVRLLVSTAHDVVLVPTAAIQPSPSGKLVYVVGADHAVKAVQVEVGAAEHDRTVVTKGVAPGDLVVTSGVDKLEQGTRVVVSTRIAGKSSTGQER
jgi:multidrug efflux system membrane fusion protein